jgi:hypothetical protein
MGDVVEPRREFIQDYSLNANVVVLLGSLFWKKAITCGKKAIARSVKAITASFAATVGRQRLKG